ncbi:MAG: hypothetical protein J5892_02275 [Bacilli bacterium]|nr:hypothetical protein [Bacilli bacterium]
MADKKEMSLQELATKELTQFDEEKKKEEVQKMKYKLLSLSVITLASVISAATAVVTAIKKCDSKVDHLKDSCCLCSCLGLEHQEKMINKQYGNEAIDTELTETINQEILKVYYIDDDYSKTLIKTFYQNKK